MRGLPYEVKALVHKARESALLAIETYNRPQASFRSGAYVVLMVIAWTSLFQAIFIRKRIKPYYRKRNSTHYVKVDGEYKRWELTECLKQYFKDHNPPLRKNLEFFVRLRNRVEHCELAELDPEIFGECQAMLLNFEQLLTAEFGGRYAIRGGLTFALQFARTLPKASSSTASKSRARRFRDVKKFIDAYRSSLSTEIQTDLSYSFKVYLVPKIGSHATKDAVAIECVRYDAAKPEEMQKYEKVVAMIKEKQVPVANLGLLKPSQVVQQVQKRLGKKFNQYQHTQSYRHFNVRPPKGAADPTSCDSRYCVYDHMHKDYGYKREWVDFLIEQLSNEATYNLIVRRRAALRAVTNAPQGAPAV